MQSLRVDLYLFHFLSAEVAHVERGRNVTLHWVALKTTPGQKVNMTFKGLGNILTLLQGRTFSLTQIIHIVAASEVNFSTDF